MQAPRASVRRVLQLPPSQRQTLHLVAIETTTPSPLAHHLRSEVESPVPIEPVSRAAISFHSPRFLQITDEAGANPGVQVVTLVPVDTTLVSPHPFRSHTKDLNCTYKDLRPAMRGCVAHEPPSTILCFSSKKSAIQVRTQSPSARETRSRTYQYTQGKAPSARTPPTA